MTELSRGELRQQRNASEEQGKELRARLEAVSTRAKQGLGEHAHRVELHQQGIEPYNHHTVPTALHEIIAATEGRQRHRNTEEAAT